MEADQPKIIFLICDDQEGPREYNAQLVREVIEKNFNPPMPHEIRLFEHAKGVIDFLQGRKNSKGVILITDGEMPVINGFSLIQKLIGLNRLPTYSIMYSGMDIGLFRDTLKDMGITPDVSKIDFISKGCAKHEFAQYLPPMIYGAGNEIGLDLPLRGNGDRIRQIRQKPEA